MKKYLAVLVGLTMLSVAPLASAESLSLHVDGSPAEVLHAPWSAPGQVITNNRFDLGMAGSAKLLFNLSPNVSFGPSTSVFYLPVAHSVDSAAVVWDFAGALRFQGSRETARWSPYLDLSAGTGKQGHVWNPEVATHAGVDFALDDTNTVWGGVFIGWDHVVQTHYAADNQTSFLDHHDGNVATAGLSLSFDFPVKPRTVVQTRVVQHETVRTVVQQVPVPVPTPAPVAKPFQLSQQVFFQKDSSDLTSANQSALDSVVQAMSSHAGYSVVVEGRASAEGTADHNLTLSKARADSVVAYLVGHGVSRALLSSVGLGAVGNPNDFINRQVDFIVVSLVRK